MTFHFDADELVSVGRRRAQDYRNAAPFPHVVIDDFLPGDVALACANSLPGRHDITWDVYTDGGRTKKLATADERVMPAPARQLIAEFNSSATIRFLEALTGITGLVPDPHLLGGGIHRVEPGGFLDIHADFNRHPHLDLERRINLLLYLNPDWQDEWGGHLELWDRSMRYREERIAPLLNRCVIFNTTDTSFHGHPEPLACPPGRARQSLAFYYYSTAQSSERHSTLYQSTARPTLRHRIGSALPPRLKKPLAAAEQRVSAALTRRDPAGPRRENHWQRVVHAYDAVAAQGPIPRPNYTWSLLHAGDIARHLGISRISAIEFGVAGGNGLVALERAADVVREEFGVTVDVTGFDNGVGLPPPQDHRDAPYLMEAGQFPMDESRLRDRLRHAQLHLGLIEDTLERFTPESPIGFISFDLDYYSSTMDALRIFDGAPGRFLPRVLCYFDDTLGYPWGDSNGERRAILDFNAARTDRVIDHLAGLRFNLPPSAFHARWAEAMYLAHILDHPRYADDEGVTIVARLDLD